MKFGFIGAGKVGIAFGIYLRKKGFHIQGYFSKNYMSAQIAAAKTNSQAYMEVEDLLHEVDFLWITTPDDEIKGVCDHLAAKNLFRKGQMIAHMSGAAPSILLEEARKQGCYVYSIHPLQSFAEIERAVKDLEKTYFSFEGDVEKINVIEDLFIQLGNPAFKLSTEHKGLYHAAACVFSNYLVTLIDQGLNYLDAVGIDREEGFRAVMPLMVGTLHNINTMGTIKALTGPIVRGDGSTIEKHIEILEKELPGAVAFYKRMGQMTLDIAAAEKLKDTKKITALENLLKEV